MVMMLPFLTGLISLGLGIGGMRRACVAFWLITLGIYLAWCKVHMTSSLALSL
jgi:hypothetical protein